jgi:hypothetical protein
MNILHKHSSEIEPMSETKAKEIEAISDEDIDFSDIPPLDEDFFKKAKRVQKNLTKSINIALAPDVAEAFKTSEEVNQALRNLITAMPKS